MDQIQCYCQSGLSFSDCCQPILNQQTKAQTAEKLMRSRYTAYYLKQVDYLINTHWPIDQTQRTSLQSSIQQTHWAGLKILQSNRGGSSDQQGEVEFVAFYIENNQILQIHEKSNFEKYDDCWFYINGKHLPPIKISRNDSCFCGSGKKYKKCHG
ncbi:YchJ family protein [Aliikangiella maris]|uniref:YchJ family protein n=2 Tax=Aliikangiella maris TaxID=3162458 RepID=A0ABV3MQF4_9GAMM